jgi:hypothetical protein
MLKTKTLTFLRKHQLKIIVRFGKHLLKYSKPNIEMKITLLHVTLFFLIVLSNQSLSAQCDPTMGSDPSGHPCIQYSMPQTTVPFMRIITDARSGAMGDVGIALTPDANAIQYNASKLALADKKMGFSVNYTPWFTNMQTKNLGIFLGHGAGYYQFGKKKKQAIGLDFRLFSMGILQWNNGYGPLKEGINYEKALTLSYSRQIKENWSVGLSAKSIQSDYISDFSSLSGYSKKKMKIIAFDMSTTYKKHILVSGIETNVYLGAVVSNLGNKFTYNREGDFLPANLGIGGSWEINFNKNSKLLVALDLKKGLVIAPRPRDTTDINKNQIPDWREISVAKSVFKSFSDSPNGFKGEMQEIATSFGLEYWFLQNFALRTGYYHENKNTGGLQYFTFGGGLRYRMFDLNVSYLKFRHTKPYQFIDNTWRFSFLANGLSL